MPTSTCYTCEARIGAELSSGGGVSQPASLKKSARGRKERWPTRRARKQPARQAKRNLALGFLYDFRRQKPHQGQMLPITSWVETYRSYAAVLYSRKWFIYCVRANIIHLTNNKESSPCSYFSMTRSVHRKSNGYAKPAAASSGSLSELGSFLHPSYSLRVTKFASLHFSRLILRGILIDVPIFTVSINLACSRFE